jgi:transcriptional regulator GlxA family with amidase domain
MLFNDAGASGASVDVVKQAYAAILCSLLGTVLDPIRGPAAVGVLIGESSARRLTAAAAEMLAADPSLSSEEIASRLGVTLGRLSRAFKSELGMSLVEHRNRLRLDRFTRLLGSGPRNLLDTALEAGFGSYAQFHRVFRALRHSTPREYVRQRA